MEVTCKLITAIRALLNSYVFLLFMEVSYSKDIFIVLFSPFNKY